MVRGVLGTVTSREGTPRTCMCVGAATVSCEVSETMGAIDRWTGGGRSTDHTPVRPVGGVNRGGQRGNTAGGGAGVTSGIELDDVVMAGWEAIVPAATRKALAKQGVKNPLYSEAVLSKDQDSVWLVIPHSGQPQIPGRIVRVYRDPASGKWRLSTFIDGLPVRKDVSFPSVPFQQAPITSTSSLTVTASETATSGMLIGDVYLPTLTPPGIVGLLERVGDVQPGRAGVTLVRAYHPRGVLEDELVTWSRGKDTAMLVVVKRAAKSGGSWRRRGGTSEEEALAKTVWSGTAWWWKTPSAASRAAVTGNTATAGAGQLPRR